MAVHILTNPENNRVSGFTNREFKALDGLYCRAVADKILTYRTVSCDFDAGIASFSYHKSEGQPPLLRFLIVREGPRTTMFELYRLGKGRIAKSGLFERVLEKLDEEIEAMKASGLVK